MSRYVLIDKAGKTRLTTTAPDAGYARRWFVKIGREDRPIPEGWTISKREVKSIAAKPTTKPTTKPKKAARPRVGCKVRILSSHREGMVGTLVADDHSSVPFLVRFLNGEEGWYGAFEVQAVPKAKPRKVAKSAPKPKDTPKPEAPRLKVGDRVRVVSKDPGDCTGGTLVADDHSSVPFLVRFLNGEEGWYYPEDLILAPSTKKPDPEQTLKVGDYVRGQRPNSEWIEGRITAILGDSPYPYRVGENGYWTSSATTVRILEPKTEPTKPALAPGHVEMKMDSGDTLEFWLETQYGVVELMATCGGADKALIAVRPEGILVRPTSCELPGIKTNAEGEVMM